MSVLDVDPDAVDHGPGDAVAVDGAQLAHAATHQVQVHALLVKGLCRSTINGLDITDTVC